MKTKFIAVKIMYYKSVFDRFLPYVADFDILTKSMTYYLLGTADIQKDATGRYLVFTSDSKRWGFTNKLMKVFPKPRKIKEEDCILACTCKKVKGIIHR